MKRLLFTVLLISTFLGAHAQSTGLEGIVSEVDSSNNLSNAIISIYGTTLITESDDNGFFSFDRNVPVGDQILNISKDGYEEQFIPIDLGFGQRVKLNVALELTKKEKKRRARLVKDLKKSEKKKAKERENAIEKARKAKKKEDKRIAKEQRRALKKGNKVVVVYEPMTENPPSNESVSLTEKKVAVEEPYLINNKDEQLKRKYAQMMGVSMDDIRNIRLYEFVDEWIGTPYRMGGHGKEGIDCSAFTQKLLSGVFNYVPERTAQTMFNGGRDEEELYADVSAIRTGDLIFFNDTASEFDEITHVGVYLEHGFFVHSTSNRGSDGRNGVQISELESPTWKRKRVAWRRMKMKN
ncbi:C40 family peptidase [Aureitalea sp. L0-47]|uniref:NlpC/P60 family protein n=1 Tax=Aureitalea sp. L0-47 TaxID=2816962 RepID=UPI00223821BD|nr:NlpC/P60 family protein [Aureitalea sp. L0-47]MCW5518542.1 C40 family peptidase [Aureitalea sp. L0-47]